MKKQSTPKLKKQATNILEKARRIMGITRDQYAFCQYVHYRCADPRQRVSGWCCDLKEEIGDFVGISRVGVHKMARAMEQSGLVSISIGGYYQITETWIDIESDCKQSLHKDGKEDVNKVYTGRKQSLQIEREKRKQSLHTPYSIDNKELEGERTPPAPNPSNLKEEKEENGLVAPAENPETVKAENPPSKKVAPKKDSPVRRLSNEEMNEVFNRIQEERNMSKEDGEYLYIYLPEDPEEPAPQFEVTAIASPADMPGVTLVESPPIQPRRSGRIEIPDEAAAEILPWANGDGAQTVKGWYSRAFRAWSLSDVERMVFKFSTVFLSSEKEATRNMMETDPLAFFKKRFSGFIVDQPAFDRLNAPKEGGATRNGKANLNHWGANPGGYEEKQAF